MTQSKSFIGEKYDPETGLLYLHARYYNPVIGRFITPDDWDPHLEGVGINRYGYAGNNVPIALINLLPQAARRWMTRRKTLTLAAGNLKERTTHLAISIWIGHGCLVFR